MFKSINPTLKRHIINTYITQEIYKKSDTESRYELMKFGFSAFIRDMESFHGGRKNWELAVAKRHGFKTAYEYKKHLIQCKGFENMNEYLDELAKEKGFKNSYERKKNYILKKYGSLKAQRIEIAKNMGFNKYSEYQNNIYIKKGFKSRGDYQRHLLIKNYGSIKNSKEELAKKAGFKNYSERRKFWRERKKNNV